ncbi:MAG: Bug family tripartite tricarboxylate transporter substrate binding protein, partial [Lautropia sp.]
TGAAGALGSFAGLIRLGGIGNLGGIGKLGGMARLGGASGLGVAGLGPGSDIAWSQPAPGSAPVAAGSVPAPAGAYPGPVRVLIGFSPGGAPDLAARLVATRLERVLGVSVVVENQAGASGTIAAANAARAEPDGRTLLFGVAANLAVAPATMARPPYDARRAFTPIVEVARGPYVWLVRADVPARTMAEFVSWSRTQSGRLNYASPGVGSVHHFAVEQLQRSTGLRLVHVPYPKGMYPGILAGDVHAMFDSMPGPLPYLGTGRVRALAITGSRRLAPLPDVPTLAEQGFADIGMSSWWGFVAPAGMPAPLVERLNGAIRAVLADPEVLATFGKWGIEPSPDTPAAFAALIAREVASWRERVAATGIRAE